MPLVLQELVKGHSHQTIFGFLTAKDPDRPELPNLTEDQAKACLAMAVRELKQDPLDRDYKHRLAESAYLMLYEKLVGCGDFNGARQAMEKFVDLNKLKDEEPRKPPKQIKPKRRPLVVDVFSLDR